MESSFERPSLPMKERSVRQSYLVRSLVNGNYYYSMKLGKEDLICAAVSPFEVKGFKTRREAENFRLLIEQKKKTELCLGRPPYMRIEKKIEQIEVGINADESSASSLM